MVILGINAYHGDSSAALLVDGQIVSAVEEERFRRIKHWAGFPSLAIRHVVEAAGVDPSDIDVITYGRDARAKRLEKMRFVLTQPHSFSHVVDKLRARNRIASARAMVADALGVSKSELRARIVPVEHHRAHLASAFFSSPFESAAVLSVDGFGDFTSTMTAGGDGNGLRVRDSVSFPHSLGIFYTTFTQWLGFPHYGDEYKVMGLAPYGTPQLKDEVWEVIRLTDDGLFKLNTAFFAHVRHGVKMSWDGGQPSIEALYSERFVQKFGAPRAAGEELSEYHRDIAASVQAVCEDVIFHLVDSLAARTGQDRLCLAGGVAQNSVANGKITDRTRVRELYVPPAGHDAGLAVGAAQFVYHQLMGNRRTMPMMSAALGPAFGPGAVRSALDEAGLSYTVAGTDAELVDQIVSLLVQGNVVGWFQGGSEFGPRALGNRSILVDPGRSDAKELLNRKIKKREEFRPFAPAICAEAVDEYFEKNETARFMERVLVIREEKRAMLPAVTHVDGTGRLQTVTREDNGLYYDLIAAFGEKSGYPVLLNTSFNENEPIVNTPEEAIATYLRTEMDVLVLGRHVVVRNQ